MKRILSVTIILFMIFSVMSVDAQEPNRVGWRGGNLKATVAYFDTLDVDVFLAASVFNAAVTITPSLHVTANISASLDDSSAVLSTLLGNGSLVLLAADTDSFLVYHNGTDVIFHTETGDFVFDANIGIGIDAPSGIIEAYKNQDGVTIIKVSNPNAGINNQARFSAASDALTLDMGVTAASTGHFESTPGAFIATASGQSLYFVDGATINLLIDGSGNVVIGHTDADGLFNTVMSANWNATYFDTFSTNNSHHSTLNFRKSDSATKGTFAETASGELLGQIIFKGVDDGNNSDVGANIQAVQDGVAGVLVPTNLIFQTHSATAENTNQLVLHNEGHVTMSGDLTVNGTISFEIPHIFIGFEDSTATIAMTQNNWAQITNAGGTLFAVDDSLRFTYIPGDTLQVNKTGHYVVNGSVSYQGNNSDTMHIVIYVNGSQVGYRTTRTHTNNDIGDVALSWGGDITSGDKITFQIMNSQSNGDAIMVSASIDICWQSDAN